MKRYAKLTPDQITELSVFIRSTEDANESRRAQCVLLINQEAPLSQITVLTGFKRRQIFKYRSAYLKNGLKGLEYKRKRKSTALLSKAQREEILMWLRTQSPKAHGYPSDYWSTSILGDLIQKAYGVVYKTKKPFYLLFEEAKMTFHKPGKVYEKRDEERVKAWKQAITPQLKETFSDGNTVLLCEDEMILSTQTTFQKIWLKKGEYPKIEVSNTKKNKSIYGFLNLKTGQEHAFINERQTMWVTVEVLKAIRGLYPTQKILLLWDGAGWHRGSAVQDFIKEDGNIEISYFPPYSPEENPQEHVWKAGRAAVTHNQFIPDIDKAAQQFIDFLNQSTFPYNFLNLSAHL